jgi:hypothetical protein
VPLLDPPALLIAAATIFVNVVTVFPYTRDYRFHYSAIVVAGCAVATVEAVAWISHRGVRARAMWTMVTSVLVAAVVTSVIWGCASYSRNYRDAWPPAHDPRVAITAAAVRAVPPGASASVAYNIDTHMTHRAQIYEFPVPWCNVNWGVRGEHLDDPAQVQYLVVDRTLFEDDSFDSARSRALLSDLLSYEFRVVSERDGIVVARRVHPPRLPLGTMPPDKECYPRPRVRRDTNRGPRRPPEAEPRGTTEIALRPEIRAERSRGRASPCTRAKPHRSRRWRTKGSWAASSA